MIKGYGTPQLFSLLLGIKEYHPNENCSGSKHPFNGEENFKSVVLKL